MWFSPGTWVYATNKSDHHNISEILLKMALNNLALTQFIVLGLTQLELEPTIYCIHGKPLHHLSGYI
jgi:hypothetical protein